MARDRFDDFIVRFEIATLEIGRSIGHCAASSGGVFTGAQQHVMRMLVRSGGMRSSELAEALGTQPSAVTAAVDRLEARGFAVRERDAEDRRVVRVAATPEGEAEFRRVEADVRSHLRTMLSVLDEEELAALVAAFEKMSRSLQPHAATHA